MDKIDISILNEDAIEDAEKMMVCAARLTQRGHKINYMSDFWAIYDRAYASETVKELAALPHPTIQKFAVINIIITGASKRFRDQIIRHQNECKFMSASLQYSNYSDKAHFVVPYELLGTCQEDSYLKQCQAAMKEYERLIAAGIDNDTAGYITPAGLRTALLISATPYQWKHMIHQRVCRRNTSETRYIMLKVWKYLSFNNPWLFSGCGPFCMHGDCQEGKMSCKNPLSADMSPNDILKADFPKLCG